MPRRPLPILEGTLDLMVLKMLSTGPASGWDLTQSIQAVSRDVLQVKYGTLYPALHRLEARALISAKWGTTDANRRARFYTITAAGARALKEERRGWREFSAALNLILDAR